MPRRIHSDARPAERGHIPIRQNTDLVVSAGDSFRLLPYELYGCLFRAFEDIFLQMVPFGRIVNVQNQFPVLIELPRQIQKQRLQEEPSTSPARMRSVFARNRSSTKAQVS